MYQKKIRVEALVNVTSHGSGGRARVLVAPSFVSKGKADASLTSVKFKDYEVGTNLVAVIWWTPKKRQLKVVSDAGITVGEFRTRFGESMKASMQEHEKFYGSETEAPSIIKVETPKGKNWVDGYYVPSDDLEAFTVGREMAHTLPTKILMVGPSGYGKTTTPEAFAKANGMNYVRFNVALVDEPESFFGFRTIVDGELKFEKSEFTKAIEQGNTVVVLDELNRASPEMANAIFPILDDSGETVVFGQSIKVAPHTIIVSTVNLGYQFVGTFAMDSALVNRMDMTIQVGPLPTDVEVKVITSRIEGLDISKAYQIVNINNKVRALNDNGSVNVDASTRTSLKVGRLVASGMKVARAFEFVLVNGADADERKELIDAIKSVHEEKMVSSSSAASHSTSFGSSSTSPVGF